MAKRPLIHTQIEQQLSHYADLTAEEKQAVDAHVATCASCRRFWQQQQLVGDALRELPAPLDQARLRQGFQQGLAQRRQPPKPPFFSQGWATATPGEVDFTELGAYYNPTLGSVIVVFVSFRYSP